MASGHRQGVAGSVLLQAAGSVVAAGGLLVLQARALQAGGLRRLLQPLAPRVRRHSAAHLLPIQRLAAEQAGARLVLLLRRLSAAGHRSAVAPAGARLVVLPRRLPLSVAAADSALERKAGSLASVNNSQQPEHLVSQHPLALEHLQGGAAGSVAACNARARRSTCRVGAATQALGDDSGTCSSRLKADTGHKGPLCPVSPRQLVRSFQLLVADGFPDPWLFSKMLRKHPV